MRHSDSTSVADVRGAVSHVVGWGGDACYVSSNGTPTCLGCVAKAKQR
jgi:hypothetical protein